MNRKVVIFGGVLSVVILVSGVAWLSDGVSIDELTGKARHVWHGLTSLQGGSSSVVEGDAKSQRDAIERLEERYALPSVSMINQEGVESAIAEILDSGRPVVLNFIFTSCGAVCPVMTSSFSRIQTKLGENPKKVQLVSISIDPENDTPQKLKEYAQKFKAGENWTFLTGSLKASLALQKAFKVHRGDKMNHPPVTFVRKSVDGPWVRLIGFATTDQVISELN
jgi:protein SCO1/2